MTDTQRRETIRDVIREISQVITFARTSWHVHAHELHPEITRACIPTLLTIAHRGPISGADLTCAQNSEKTVISKQVSLLKNLGLVDTQVNSEDRRVLLISVTEHGQERINHVRELLVDRYEERFEGFSAEDIGRIQTLLHRFNETRA